MGKAPRFKLCLGLLVALALAGLLSLPVFALIGDVNLDNRVSEEDLSAIAQSLGLYQTNPVFDRFLDLNLDDHVDVMDLAIAGRSHGATRIFHYPRQISNCDSCAYKQDTCLDGLDRINVVWSSSSKVYYSRLDRFGNTLVDDYLLDTVSSTAPVAVGCDDAGNAHVIWDCGSELCQARFDRWGYAVLKPQVAYDEATFGEMDIDLDAQGNAHAFFMRYWRNIQTYARFDPEGKLTLGSQGLLSGDSNTSTPYRSIAVDGQGNVHLIWYELVGDDRVYYARYSASASPTVGDTVLGLTGYDGTVNSARRPDLAVAADGSAFILFPQTGTTKHLFVEKIAPNGDILLNDYDLFTQWHTGGYTPYSVIALDQASNLHLLSITDWERGVYHTAYGTFTPDAVSISPMRWMFYGRPMHESRISLDSQDDVQLTFRNVDGKGNPPCGDDSLCYLGTGFSTDAYDITRSDLGVDAAHLIYDPVIARWGQSVTITTTVFNAGWITAPGSSLLVALETPQGDLLAQTQADLPSLNPRVTHTLSSIVLQLPNTPPAGMEEMEYLRLRLEVDPTKNILETTESNNLLSVPLLVQKLPTKTGLFLMVRDDTNSVRMGEGEWVNRGTASIQSGAYSRTGIPVTANATILGDDIPVTSSLTNYTIDWQANGYAIPAPAVIGVERNTSDPYLIDYHPGNTAVLVTNRWGSLSGVITAGGNPLAGATVKLVGQGLSIETTTDASGAYSPSSQPKLGQLIPGEYTLRVSMANYARHIETIEIAALQNAVRDRSLVPTTDAYIHGNLVNTFGNPVVGATVNACGSTVQSDEQGVFDLEPDASCSLLTVSRTGYATLNEPLALTAGVELILGDLSLEFDPPLSVFSRSDKVGSRVIDQSSGDLLPEPPEDANWAEKQIYDKFKDKFWAEYRIFIVYGGYAYHAAAGYSGPTDDRRMNYVQVRFVPKTFEVHMLLTTVTLAGAPIPVPLVDDSGDRSAIWAIEARLVNVKSGQVLKTVNIPLEGASAEPIFEDTTLTYDFGSQAISDVDWANTEVWFYYKIGKNDSGTFNAMPQLYQHDRQILKFDLDSGLIWIDYGLGDFPLP